MGEILEGHTRDALAFIYVSCSENLTYFNDMLRNYFYGGKATQFYYAFLMRREKLSKWRSGL